MTVPQGTFRLRRHPHRERSTLRAWDAADEYLLAHVHELGLAVASWVVVNDSFGALTVALAAHEPLAVSDSILSQRGTLENAAANGLDPSRIRTASPLDPLPERVDVAVLKTPKTTALLEDELRRLRASLHPSSVVLAAGMSRHVHSSTLETFEAIIGPTTTSKARKKARLIHSRVDPELDPGPSPFPRRFQVSLGGDERIPVVAHANVFNRGRPDPGTALLVDSLRTTPPSFAAGPGDADGAGLRILDVGCGSGLVGITASRMWPAASVSLVDESYHAVASASATLAATGVDDSRVVALVADALEDEADASVDLIVSNPPFHDDHAVGDEIAWRIFTGARRVLRPGGELRVVGNRHLGHHVRLKRIFGASETISADPKFVVVKAQR